MPRGEYIDWETERDGQPLWVWCRGEHTRGASWTDIGAALGMKGDTVRKAVLRIERDLLDSTRMPRPKEQGAELPKTLPLRDAARAAWDAYAPDLSGIHPPVPVEPTEPVVQTIEHPGGIPPVMVNDNQAFEGDLHQVIADALHDASPAGVAERKAEALRACADEEQELSARVQAQQRGVELVERWREEDAQHSTLADAYRDAQSEQRIAMLEELLDIERNAEQEVTAERTVELPEDLARDALIAYAWVSAKTSRWDKAYDSRDAVETAEAMLRERAA